VTPRKRSGQPERTVEGGEKPIAGCLDLATTKSSEFAANHSVVAIEKIAPTAVAKRGRFLRRADYVREEHCSENAVGLGGVTDARQKLFDLPEDRFRVSEPWKVVLPRQFDEPRPRNPLRHISARADGYCRIAHAMEQQCRDTDRGKDVPNINFVVHCDERQHRGGTRAHSEQPAPPLRESFVPDHARRARRGRRFRPIRVASARSMPGALLKSVPKGSPAS
jgi:hypothetical protein